MPSAVVHFIVPVIIAELIRKFSKYKFPRYYILIAGLAGVFIDLDIALYWVLYSFSYTLEQIHRTYTHSLFVPLIFSLLAFWKKDFQIGKYKFNTRTLFLMIALGAFLHLVLDALLSGGVMLFYPVSLWQIGFEPFSSLPASLQSVALGSLDAALLIIWVIYEELSHRMSQRL